MNKTQRRETLSSALETAKPFKKSCKTAKPRKKLIKTENRLQNRLINLHIPVIKTLIGLAQVVKSEAYIAFAIIRDQWRRIISAQTEEKPEPKKENTQTTSHIKSANPLVLLTKTGNQMVKKISKPRSTPKPKDQRFPAQKTKNRSKIAKTENPNAPIIKHDNRSYLTLFENKFQRMV